MVVVVVVAVFTFLVAYGVGCSPVVVVAVNFMRNSRALRAAVTFIFVFFVFVVDGGCLFQRVNHKQKRLFSLLKCGSKIIAFFVDKVKRL